MQTKIKSLALVLVVLASIVVVPLSFVVPASAATNSPQEEVESFIYYRAIAHCFDHGGDLAVPVGDAGSYNWFPENQLHIEIGVGYMNGADGTALCSDTGFISRAMAMWGYTDGLTAWCDVMQLAGPFQDKPGLDQTGVNRDCATGNGTEVNTQYGDKRAEAFKRGIEAKYYGGGGNEPKLSQAAEYYVYMQTFRTFCSADPVAQKSQATPAQLALANTDKGYTIKTVNQTGGVEEWIYQANGDKDKNSRVVAYEGTNNEDQQFKPQCGELATWISNAADAYGSWQKAHPSAALPSGNSSSSTPTDGEAIGDCGGGGFNWVICPLIFLIQKATGLMDKFFISTLTVDVKPIFDTTTKSGQAYYTAWNSFRVLATALIIVAGLVMVMSQALGFDFLDAYTIRKVLPRLVVAIIGISLSWPLMKFTVEFFNILGVDIRNIIYAPFQGVSNGIQVGQGVAAYIGIAIGWGTITALGLLSFVGTALLAMLVAFFILVFRQLAIVVLVILAPVAIACYILPNTEKVWKLWKDNFLGFMLMFPIVSAFIAAGHVIAAVAFSDSASGSTTGSSIIAGFIGLAALIGSYFSLVFAARLATGLVGTLAGFVNDRGKGGFDRLKKYRAGRQEQRMGYYKDKYGTQIMQGKASAVRALNRQAAKRGAVGGYALRRLGRGIEGKGNNLEAQMSALNAKRAKELGDQIATGDDAEIRGLSVNLAAARRAGALNAANGYNNGLMRRGSDGAMEYKTLGGAWVNETAVRNGQKKWGSDVAAQQASLAYEMRKASSEEELQGLAGRYRSLAKEQWNMSDTQAGGAWIGASFEHQNSHLEFKNTNWETGGLKADKATGMKGADFVKEVYEKRGSYNMAQMGSNTFQQLKEAYKSADLVAHNLDQNGNAANYSAQQITAAKQQTERIAGIAETFMHEAGYGGGQVGTTGDDHVPINAPGGNRSRQANTPGAAHTAERVRELAEMAGVGPSGSSPSGTYTGNPNNQREQN